MDLSINLLPKFKKMRFDYHCGRQFREWRLEIELMKEKLINQSNLQGLKKLEHKAKELDEWKR